MTGGPFIVVVRHRPEVELGDRVAYHLSMENTEHPSPWWQARNRAAVVVHTALGGTKPYEPWETWRHAHDHVAVPIADGMHPRPGTPEARGALF